MCFFSYLNSLESQIWQIALLYLEKRDYLVVVNQSTSVRFNLFLGGLSANSVQLLL